MEMVSREDSKLAGNAESLVGSVDPISTPTINLCSRPTLMWRTKNSAGRSVPTSVGSRIQPHMSDLNDIGRIVQCVKYEVDIGAVVPRQRPTPRNKVPDVVPNPLTGTWRAVWSLTGHDFSNGHTGLGSGEELPPCRYLNAAFSDCIRSETGSVIHSVNGHSKRIDVTLISSTVIPQTKSRGGQQLRGGIPNSVEKGGRSVDRVPVNSIGNDREEPIVGKAGMEIAVDENVCLWEAVSEIQRKRLSEPTGLRSPCTISNECRCCNPPAASASFRVEEIQNAKIEVT